MASKKSTKGKKKLKGKKLSSTRTLGHPKIAEM
jgi:hypothetical protein